VRRVGNSTEFEQIKEYVKGDDIRHINWKASAKVSQLMVNSYVEEKSKQIYCIIDTGRAMEMPFDNMTLLDYSINASLALSHVVIKNHDRAGLIYFNTKVDKMLPADRSITQITKILNTLYKVSTEFRESNLDSLYTQVKFKIGHRSLLLLFTNFEDQNSLRRQLPYLKGMSKNNVLVVIMFKNSELEHVLYSKFNAHTDYFRKAVTEKYAYQKMLMVKELQRHGIQSVLSRPEELTTEVINKYLEVKSRGIL
jgi:uncharacterized protein (DUF58 family)